MAAMEEANRRLEQGIEDLRVKYDRIRAEEAEQAEVDARKQARAARAAEAAAEEAALAAPATDVEAELVAAEEHDDDDDLARIRAARIAQMKRLKEAAKRTGGELTEIVEDEFLPLVTSTKMVVCSFTHPDFSKRCDVLRKHLRVCAELLPSTKFLIMDASKTPFFVEKLSVRVIPTTVFFINGISKARMQGFDGLVTTEGAEDFTVSSLIRRVRREHCADHDETAAALHRIGAEEESDGEGDDVGGAGAGRFGLDE